MTQDPSAGVSRRAEPADVDDPGPGTRMPGGAGDPALDAARTTPRWATPALVAVLGLTALGYLWDLSASGYANSFYAAAVQAGTKSWKAFFFGSLDSSNFITVDKPPASLWLMDLSGRIFGFSSWSLLIPDALAGVAAVAVLYFTVKRWFGAPAGLLSAVALATTPVAAAMFRYDNPDAVLVLLLVAAAYTLVRAIDARSTRWVVATGGLLGLAFLAKMLQGFTVLPAFALVFLLAAPGTLRRRVLQLVAGGAAIAVAAGWWVAIVALWPAGDRPMIDGSPTNSIVNLILGYNGFGRLTGNGSGGGGGIGGGFGGTPGVLRMFNDVMAGQASWLLPVALLTVVVGVAWRARAPRTDRTRAALALWGGWLVVTAATFSFGKGIIHTYYTVAFAPAVAALFGIGVALLWRNRRHLAARVIGALGLAGTAVWSMEVLDRSSGYHPWLRPVVLAGGIAAAVALLGAPYLGRLSTRTATAGIGIGVLASLAGPSAYAATTIVTPESGSLASAGPAVTTGGAGAFGPGRAGFGRAVFGRPGFGGTGAASAPPGGLAGGPPGGAFPGASGALPGASGASPGAGASTAQGSVPTAQGGAPTAQGVAPTGRRGAFGGFGGAGGTATTSAALTAALRSGASSYRWVAATSGSQSAADLELSSGEAVMAIGGFSGQGGNITLATFESYVARHQIHYYLGGGGGRGPGGSSSGSAIASWVASRYKATTVGGQTVYDLTAPR